MIFGIMRYDHKKIEAKWQKFWLENKTFKVENEGEKPKYYVLDMFPYPSGAGLHVGHVEGYTASDILARYHRQRGFDVLHPMGWDSFGLPAEQYAVRTGTHPAATTQKNINNFRRQLKLLGFSYDWDREVTTSDPKYYKWTQWIFTKLYEKGLAYEAHLPVNYCPALGTVLANEEVEAGKAKEGGHPVERRLLRQWVLKITAYADRLIEDLDLIDWPEGLKRLQINWIGRSEGLEVTFPIDHYKESLTVFTTRQDTLFGATYMVVAPEHPLLEKITTDVQRPEVTAYQQKTASKSDFERTELVKEKTGVFTGAYAINPVNQHKIPIWVSDYVLMSYGTGAIMAVPAHDERDFEFAKIHSLEITPVYEPENESEREAVLAGELCLPGRGTCINSANDAISLNGKSVDEAKEMVTSWLEQMGIGKKTINFKLRDWLFSRQRYWGEPFPILHFEDGTHRMLNLDELPLCPPEVSDYKPAGDGRSPLSKVPEWVEVKDALTGRSAKRETHTMPQWAGSCWYYLRYCDPHNENAPWDPKAEKRWLPVDMYIGGVEHAVLHLLYARFWHKVLYDCGLVSTKEPFKALRNQGLIVSRSYQDANNVYIDPVFVNERNGEYFHSETGEQLRSQLEKMSKSKLNGVNPDEVIEEFGSDALRLYEMFMGPLEKEKPWSTDAVSGSFRFLKRFYEMAFSEKVSDVEDEEGTKLGHRLIAGVTKDVEALQFNTAIAKMMEFINAFTKLPHYPKSVLKMATQALQPFAPHLAEEVWEKLGCKESLSYTPYPKVDPRLLEDEMITYVIQVNGKLRGRFDFPKGQTEEFILSAAREDSSVSKSIDGKQVVKVIFVPNKLLNIVVS